MAVAPTIFTAHAVTDGSSNSLRFVPHRFSWGAFWFGSVWALKHRLWMAALAMLVFDAALFAAVRVGWLAGGAGLLLWLLASLAMGLEGQEWRRRAIARRGAWLAGFGYGVDEADVLARLAFQKVATIPEGTTP